MNKQGIQRKIFIASFLFIPIILLLAFVVYPTIDLFRMSLTSWDGVNSVRKFIGFENYKTIIFNSPDIWLSLRNNSLYFFIHLIFIPIELVIAMVLNSKIKGSKYFKTIVFLPYIINGVAVAYTFSFFYSPINGPLNGIMEFLGLGGAVQNWLSNEHIVNFSLVAISLWKYCGLHIVIFIAALQSIPEELMEAAVIDGASTVQRFLKIVIPMITTVIELILFLNIRGALQQFDIPFVVTHGGPGYASSTFTFYSIDMAFKYYNFGMASTMGVTLLILILIFSWLQQKIFNMGRR